ncbi:MAG TPA: hypothetical protein VMO81_05985 [Aestuariivirgaceae bacterium]|nr:hypothetical protein [Aestuariivirgaceae bacterium]
MRRILSSEIEALLPPRALEIAGAAERSERNHLLTMASIAEGRA